MIIVRNDLSQVSVAQAQLVHQHVVHQIFLSLYGPQSILARDSSPE